MFSLIAFVWGSYRAKDLFVTDLMMPEQVFSLVEDLGSYRMVQVYGSGPAIHGFFFGAIGSGSNYILEDLIILFTLSRTNILVRPFRATSGVVLYNLQYMDTRA